MHLQREGVIEGDETGLLNVHHLILLLKGLIPGIRQYLKSTYARDMYEHRYLLAMI
jgi:hypothetical protein